MSEALTIAPREATQPEGTVYCVQDPPIIRRAGGPGMTKDLSSAQRYGKIVMILEAGRQSSMEPGPCLQALNRGLRSFDPTKDYLVFPGGDPMSLGLAMIALQYNGVKSFQFLRWERERSIDGERLAGAGFYVPVRVSLVV